MELTADDLAMIAQFLIQEMPPGRCGRFGHPLWYTRRACDAAGVVIEDLLENVPPTGRCDCLILAQLCEEREGAPHG